MAAPSGKTLGCSGCLIEAIERHDEEALRALLSRKNVYFNDSYLLPNDCSKFMIPLAPPPNTCKRIPMLSADRVHQSSKVRCTHLLIEFTDSMPHFGIAMSVVLTAMLHTTAQFNAFQLLVESQKFDLSSTIEFDWNVCKHPADMRSKQCRRIRAHPVGMALLIDRGSDVSDGNSFLLMKTLKQNFLLETNALCVTEFMSQNCRISTQIEATDAVSFFNGCCNFEFARELLASGNDDNSKGESHTLSILQALRDMDILLLNSHSPLYYYRTFKTRYGWINRHVIDIPKLITALMELLKVFRFNARSEFNIGQLIRNGWICAEKSDEMAHNFVYMLHFPNSSRGQTALRITRQLLALGFFSEQEMWNNLKPRYGCGVCGSSQAAHIVEDDEVIEEIVGHQNQRHACRPAARLLKEFFRNPLSLQQLSRIQIRLSIGIYNFERFVKTLPLPPPLLAYVWRANEMLA